MPHVYPGKQLADVINNMSDDERYELLSTLRTGAPLSNKMTQVRWYFLRGIVIRAYKKRCHYYVNRVVDWYQSDWHRTFRPGGIQPSIPYYKEVALIIELANYIKNYKQTPVNHVLAVRKALKAYYMNFSMLETHGYMREAGVSFRTKNKYGEVSEIPYRELSYFEKLLKTNNMDITASLQQWNREQEDKYDRWLKGEINSKHVYKVTPARLLGTYIKLVRHLTARSLATSTTFTDLISEYNQYEKIQTIDDLTIPMQDALDSCSNVALYLDDLRKQCRYTNQKIYGSN